MAIITEDYVSFTIAKLLKEKGFDCSCEHQYINCSSGYPFLTDIRDDAGCYYKNSEIGEDEYSAPTLQMAMKWLKEEHKIYIAISPISGKGYNAILCDVGDFNDFNYIGETDCFFHPEEAAETGIKYCLENLI